MRRCFPILLILFCTTLHAQQWIGDLADGLRLARENDRKVLLFFSVADGCAVCRDLEQKVFASPGFIAYAADRFVMVKEDFSEGTPEAKIEHLAIVEKYNRDGFFPLVLILDSSGKVLTKTGPYEGESAELYIRMLEKP